MARQSPAGPTRQQLADILWGGDTSTSGSRLLIGALEAFAELGFERTTTRDIASRGQLSPAAVYIHYRSKEELLHLIIHSAHEELLRRMQEAARGNGSPVDRLKAVVKAHVAFHAQWYTAAKVANRELTSLEPEHKKAILAVRAQIESLMDKVIMSGVRSGHFEVVDRKATNYAILSVGIGVCRWFRPDGRLSPDELGTLYASLIARMITRLPGHDMDAGEESHHAISSAIQASRT